MHTFTFFPTSSALGTKEEQLRGSSWPEKVTLILRLCIHISSISNIWYFKKALKNNFDVNFIMVIANTNAIISDTPSNTEFITGFFKHYHFELRLDFLLEHFCECYYVKIISNIKFSSGLNTTINITLSNT